MTIIANGGHRAPWELHVALLGETLIEQQALAERIAEMGLTIRAWYEPETPITVVGVLRGCFVFMADLVRAIPGPVTCEFVGLQSYEDTESRGVVKATQELTVDVAGRHVLVVEDIVDTGLTLDHLRRMLLARNPESLCVVSLLDKPSRRKVHLDLDLTGFTIEDRFVVGFGLDYNGLYRNLPYIAVLDPERS